MFSNKVILVAPLDWGLGHATRMVPLIRTLSANNKVIICTTAGNDHLFQSYFPAIQRVPIPSYSITYSRRLPVTVRILLSLPRIFKRIRDERRSCARLAGRYSADVVISDNRYGFWSPDALNVFVTHQLRFFTSGGRIAGWVQARLVSRRFSEVWIPDHAEPHARLAGELCEAEGFPNVKYIGPQSALSGFDASNKEPLYDFLLLLSGPEPQRTQLEKALVKKFSGSRVEVAMARGTIVRSNDFPAGWKVFNLPWGAELAELINRSRTVVCRSGYSTLMDLHLLGKKEIILIPTPGQPEQEYLAAHWKQNFGAAVWSQDQVSTARIP